MFYSGGEKKSIDDRYIYVRFVTEIDFGNCDNENEVVNCGTRQTIISDK